MFESKIGIQRRKSLHRVYRSVYSEYIKLFFEKLVTVGIAAVADGTKENRIRINEHKKYSVAPSNTERERKGVIGKFLCMKSGIPPIFLKQTFLLAVQSLNIWRKLMELFPKLFGVDNIHRRVRMRPAFQSRNARLKETRSLAGCS